MRLQPGTLLQGDKYRIIDVLGQGGFGITYLAEQVMAERKVCIKEFFPKEYYNRDEDSRSISLGSQGSAEIMDLYKAKFIKEAKTIAKLDHPNIIHIHDVFAENNTAYYVMEYIDGESLSALVKERGALPEKEAVGYIKQVATALDYIHERKIMHLDVKPANVMFRKEDGKPVLIDFGLSKQYDAEGNQTSSTPVGISHGFAPMEQYKMGGVKEFSPETDIYSLGATLYYLVTGNVPPQAADIADDGLPALPSHLSANVRNAIERSMEVQRKKRPHSTKEFVALLDDNEKVVPIIPVPQSESTVITAASANTHDESTKLGGTPTSTPKAEAPKKEWTPKYSTEKPKKSDDEKKSRWWMWLLGLLLIGGGAYLILGTNGGDDSDDNSGKKRNDAQRSESANAEILEEAYTEQMPMAMEMADNEDETHLAEEAAAREAEQQRLAEEEAQQQRIAEQKKKEEAARKAEQQQKQAKKANAPKEEEKLAIPDLQISDNAFDEFSLDTEEEVVAEDDVFTILEESATFMGGNILTFRNWVMRQVKYPVEAIENGIQGTVSISFVVDENGNIGRFEVLSSPDYILTEVVLNILKKSPKWEPGKQRGKAVKQKFNLPVSFKLQ